MHLDNVLATHREIQNSLFRNDNGDTITVTEHLQSLISRSFSTPTVPAPFLYLPEALGGLNLQNPFIPLLLVRERLISDPEQIIREFHTDERSWYEHAKRSFDASPEHRRRQHYHEVFEKDRYQGGGSTGSGGGGKAPSILKWEDAQTFPSYEDCTQWRERSSGLLLRAYERLLEQPEKSLLNVSLQVSKELERLSREVGDQVSEEQLSAEAKWMIMYHSEELFREFGGLSMVDRTLLPLGVLKAMQSRKVTWQMVL